MADVSIVMHNMQQAARAPQGAAFFHMGEMLEWGPTERIFTQPRDERTLGYVTGRYG